MGKHLRPEDRPPRALQPARAARRLPFWKRAFIAVLIVIAGAVSVAAGMSIAQRRPLWQVIAAALTPSPQQLFGKNNLLVLVEGLDYDYNALDEEYSSKARSDIIWAVNLDFAANRVYQLSIPRDMVATYPGGRLQKINQAQSDGGVGEAQSVISSFLGIPRFDRYVIFRVNTAKHFIDAVGGVDVKVMNSDCGMHPHSCVNGPLDYDDTWGHLHIHLKPGVQHLTGEQAVGYMRFRHDWCGDPCRIMRQQQVLHALIGKLASDKFNTLLHLNQLIAVLNGDVTTNFSTQEEVSIATAFASMPKNAIQTKQVPYAGEVTLPDGGAAIVADESARDRLVRNMLIAPPEPSSPPDPSAIAALAPSSLRVDVENGTGIPGMARRMAAILRSEGFQIAQVGNAPSANVSTTQVREHSRIAYAGVKVRDALGASASRVPVVSDALSNSALPSDVTVILGQDLISAITAQTAPQ